MSEQPDVLDADLLTVINPYAATEASNAVVDAAAAEAFMRDDLGGHVKGGWTWETIPADGRRNYRALVVAIISAAARETAAQQ